MPQPTLKPSVAPFGTGVALTFAITRKLFLKICLAHQLEPVFGTSAATQ